MRELIGQRWQAMREDSPNRQLAQPVIRCYAAAARDPRDLPQILRLLAVAARADAEPAPAIVALAPGVSRWAIMRLFGRVVVFLGTWQERLSAALDMAVARPRISVVAALALALVAFGPLSVNVARGLDGRSDVPPAAEGVDPNATADTTAAGRAVAAAAPSNEAAAPAAVTGVDVAFRSPGTCGGGFFSTQDVAVMSIVFTGDVVARAVNYRPPVFEPIADASGRSIASASMFSEGWRPLRNTFFESDPPADPRTFCVDVMFEAPAGGFPATVDLRGHLPLEVRDPSNDVRFDGLASVDATPRAIEGVRTRDAALAATVSSQDGVLLVTLEGAASGEWVASLVDAVTGTESPTNMRSSYDQVQQLGFYLSDGLQGKHLVLYRRAQVNVPFQLSAVQLVKHEGS